MAFPAVASAKALSKRILLFHCPLKPPSPPPLKFSFLCSAPFSTNINTPKITQQNYKAKSKTKQNSSSFVESQVKRRTRSDRELDEDNFLKHYGNDDSAHVPVMLGEVLDVFASIPLRSFVDCTLGAAGHSSAVKCFCFTSTFLFWKLGLSLSPISLSLLTSLCHRNVLISCCSTISTVNDRGKLN